MDPSPTNRLQTAIIFTIAIVAVVAIVAIVLRPALPASNGDGTFVGEARRQLPIQQKFEATPDPCVIGASATCSTTFTWDMTSPVNPNRQESGSAPAYFKVYRNGEEHACIPAGTQSKTTGTWTAADAVAAPVTLFEFYKTDDSTCAADLMWSDICAHPGAECERMKITPKASKYIGTFTAPGTWCDQTWRITAEMQGQVIQEQKEEPSYAFGGATYKVGVGQVLGEDSVLLSINGVLTGPMTTGDVATVVVSGRSITIETLDVNAWIAGTDSIPDLPAGVDFSSNTKHGSVTFCLAS